MFPDFNESKKNESDTIAAQIRQGDLNEAASDWKYPKRKFSEKEFLTIQAYSLFFAVTVEASLRLRFGVLKFFGIASIAYIFMGLLLQTIEYMRRRKEPRFVGEKVGSSPNSHLRNLLVTAFKTAPIGIYSGIIYHNIHPFIAQLGALCTGIIVIGDLVILWQSCLKKVLLHDKK